jgi:hypothetical protein
MQIRGAASLADVPYWRKPKNRLTVDILPAAGRFLKAFFAHPGLLRVLFTIIYMCLEGEKSSRPRRPVSFGFRGNFYRNFRAALAVKSPTI